MPAEPKTYKRKSTQFKPLTAMQEAYCQSYIKTPENQSQAAINAGFSPNTAAVKASVMMRDERIQKRISMLRFRLADSRALPVHRNALL